MMVRSLDLVKGPTLGMKCHEKSSNVSKSKELFINADILLSVDIRSYYDMDLNFQS